MDDKMEKIRELGQRSFNDVLKQLIAKIDALGDESYTGDLEKLLDEVITGMAMLRGSGQFSGAEFQPVYETVAMVIGAEIIEKRTTDVLLLVDTFLAEQNMTPDTAEGVIAASDQFKAWLRDIGEARQEG